MPKQSQTVEMNNFVGGLITEASPLNFPPNASQQEINFVLNRDGTRDRRLGMDYETDYQFNTTGVSPEALKASGTTAFRWDSVGEDTNLDFLVVQFGNKIHVYNILVDNITQTGPLGILELDQFDGAIPVSFTSIDGGLVIATGNEFIYLITYVDEAFVVTTQRLLVRDLWGLDDFYTLDGVTYDLNSGNDISRRPISFTDSHLYNVRNQSFGKKRRIDASNKLDDPINEVSRTAAFPSNADVMWRGMGFETEGGNTHEEFDANLMVEADQGSSSAGKGAFVIDALRRGASRTTEMTENDAREGVFIFHLASALNEDRTPGGATEAVEFAGRVCYGGFSGSVIDGDSRSPRLASYILFSQLVEGPTDIGKCYQTGDPTSRDESDILATDGGFIRISGMNRCHALISISNKLVVIGDNGVWMVSGGSDYGFAADNFLVTKITDYGSINRGSVVSSGNDVFYWAEDGIYHIGADQFGDFKAENMTQATIQTFYDDIPLSQRIESTGLYDKYDNKVRWIYNATTDVADNQTLTRELVLDLNLNAFYPSEIATLPTDNPPRVVGMVETPPYRRGVVTNDVTVNGVIVTAGGINVTTSSTVRSTGVRSIKYITLRGDGENNPSWTLSHYRNAKFADWFSQDSVGVDAKATLLTGAITAGAADKKKQVNYLNMYFHKTEDGFETDVSGDWTPTNPSGCLVQSQWDWTNNSNAGKWSRTFQAYRLPRHYLPMDLSDKFDSGYSVIKTKSKLRGRGNAFSMYIETEPAKDCRILGWSLAVNGNQIV